MNSQPLVSAASSPTLSVRENGCNPLSDGQKKLVSDTAAWIKKHGLETPALFFLESNRPLQGILRVSLVFSQPLLGAIVGFQRVENWSELLSSPLAADALAKELESNYPGAH